jgi:hypothetical protein
MPMRQTSIYAALCRGATSRGGIGATPLDVLFCAGTLHDISINIDNNIDSNIDIDVDDRTTTTSQRR